MSTIGPNKQISDNINRIAEELKVLSAKVMAGELEVVTGDLTIGYYNDISDIEIRKSISEADSKLTRVEITSDLILGVLNHARS